MRIESVPKDDFFVDDENNKNKIISSSWLNYFSILSDELQFHSGSDGYLPAQLTQAQLDSNESKLQRRMTYNEDEQEFTINNSGINKEVATIIEMDAATIAALPAIEKKGFIYDSTNDKFFVGIGGVLREIAIT